MNDWLDASTAPVEKEKIRFIAEKFLDDSLWSEYLYDTISYDPALDVCYVSFNPFPWEGVIVVQVDTVSLAARFVEINIMGASYFPVAYLDAEVSCPNCNSLVRDIFPFMWGGCIDRYSDYPEPIQCYKLGDPVRWLEDVPSRIDDMSPDEANIGSPSVRSLMICNSAWYTFGPCSNCQYSDNTQSALINISNGVIDKVSLCAWVEYSHITALTQEVDGTYVPWYKSKAWLVVL